MFKSPLFKFLDFLFTIPFVHDLLFGVYRKQIVEKAEQMGLDWTGFLTDLRESQPDLDNIVTKLRNPDLTIPDYFFAPIHAYRDGNLCWDSAMEEDLWSKMMISPLYNNALDGDVQMRQQWLAITSRVVGRSSAPKKATDLGCGTGLSMYMLDSKWPSLETIQGIDMSIFKLAIAEDKKKFMPEAKSNKYILHNGAAESTPVESGTQDLVSLCLVAHESPKWVSESFFAEAYRILKPGGVFTMLDLDKDRLENLLENPFVAAIYKQTEPYMSEFLKLDPMVDLVNAGFEVVEVDNASRSHKVYVAKKPELSTV